MLNANELLKKAIKQVISAGIVPGTIKPNVKINTRSLTRMGLCTFKGREGVYEIEINELLLKSNNEMAAMNTMVHEVLHTCAGCMNHGKLWKSYAATMNAKFGYNIKTRSTYAERGIEAPKGKYSICCTNKKCGTRYEKNRISGVIRNPERYSCGVCKSKLVVIDNTRTSQVAAETAVTEKPKRKTSTKTSTKKSTTTVSKTKAKYVIQCTKCKTEYGRNRMSKAVKNVSAYKCRCGGSLKLL